MFFPSFVFCFFCFFWSETSVSQGDMKRGSQDVQGILRTVWTLVGNTGHPSRFSPGTRLGKAWDVLVMWTDVILAGGRESPNNLETFLVESVQTLEFRTFVKLKTAHSSGWGMRVKRVLWLGTPLRLRKHWRYLCKKSPSLSPAFSTSIPKTGRRGRWWKLGTEARRIVIHISIVYC